MTRVTMTVLLGVLLAAPAAAQEARLTLDKIIHVAVDLQVVEPGLKKDIDSAGRLQNVGTAVVGGLRVFTRF